MVAESDDTALSDEERELVFAGVGEGGELDAGDFGTDYRCQFLMLDAGDAEDVGEGGVGISAVLVVLEGLKGGPFGVVVPDWEVLGILEYD